MCSTCGKERPDLKLRFCSILEIKLKYFTSDKCTFLATICREAHLQCAFGICCRRHLEQCTFGIICITVQAAELCLWQLSTGSTQKHLSESTSGVNINFLIEWGRDSNPRRYRRADTKLATLTTRPRLLTIVHVQI